jgi:excisionase family DNA binding protein
MGLTEQETTENQPVETVLLLRVEEAALRLGIARTSMFRLVGTGEVESVQVGRLRHIPVACLEEYIQRRRQGPSRVGAEAMDRNLNRASSVYLGRDGYWHGRVTVGLRDNGTTDRRHIMSKSKATVVKKVRTLERTRDQGKVARAGRSWTVSRWLGYWLEELAKPSIRESSYNAYRTAVEKHLVPAIGGQRLDRLEPEHLESLYRRMVAAGAKPATAHQVRRTVRTALGEAQRRGHIARNPAQLARPPRPHRSHRALQPGGDAAHPGRGGRGKER